MITPNSNCPSVQKDDQINRPEASIPCFLNQVAHDFRTPLTVIKEFATLMRDGLAGEVNSNQFKYLDIINDRADDLAIIVDNLLDAAKQSAGILRSWRQTVDMAELVHSSQPALARKTTIRQIEFEVIAEDHLPNVHADREQLVRVLANVVTGLMRCFEQTESIRIWSGRDSQSDQVELGVTATGQQCVSHVFDLMSRAFDQTQSYELKSSNNGIGLLFAVTRQLIDFHNGQIHLEHPTDGQVTIRISLPIDQPRQIFEAYLRHLRAQGSIHSEVEMHAVSVETDVLQSAAGVVDEFLQSSVGTNDLVVRMDDYHWLLLVHGEGDVQEDAAGRIDSAWSEMRGDLHGNLLPVIEWADRGRWNLNADVTALAEQFEAKMACATV